MPSAKRVLLVDDDETLRTSLAEQFAMNGYQPVVAGTCAEGQKLAQEGLYEFIVLDVRLPDGDGAVLCRELRARGITCPVVMLTAADSDESTITGLGAGANDYVTKPFRFNVLMARLEAHSRSHQTSEEAIYKIGPYTFRPSAKILLESGRRVRLTEKETNILKFLQRSGDTVSREVLLHEVWGYNPAVTTHTLETHIYRLRQKIEKDSSRPELLVTETGGYRLR